MGTETGADVVGVADEGVAGAEADAVAHGTSSLMAAVSAFSFYVLCFNRKFK